MVPADGSFWYVMLVLALSGCGKTASLQDVSGAVMGAPCVEDPGSEGRLHTAHFDLNVPVSGGMGRLQTTVFGPSDDGTSLSPVGAPYPLVVLSPAKGIGRDQYLDYAYRLANHGFVAVVQSPRTGAEGDHRQYQRDTSSLLDWLGSPSGVDSERVSGLLDPAHAGLLGHGLGGKISFLVAQGDRRVDAVLGLDPVDDPGLPGDNPSALAVLPGLRAALKTGLLGEDHTAALVNSCTPSARNYQRFYDLLPAPTFAIDFVTAGHMDFVDDLGSCVQCIACGEGAPDKQVIHGLAVKFTTAFFQTYLKGCAATESYLTGADFARDSQSGLLMLRQKSGR